MNEIIYLLSLQNKQGVGNLTLRKLIEIYGSAENVFKADISDLIKSGVLNQESAQSIKGFKKWDIYLNEYKNVMKSRYEYLTYKDNNYPCNLKNIYNIPLLLQYYGKIEKNDELAVAVIGSRNYDDYGKSVTELIVKQLVDNDITVVSGMARGIDSIAHRSAIKYGGRTIAVIGTGLDICYPPENRELFEIISQNGYVVTEYSLGTKPERINFPRRNRIISGLSLGVLIVQASTKSGALITANYAIEQNREVFAIPGNINNIKSSGCNSLIKKGAKLVENIEDIISEIKIFQGRNIKNNTGNNAIDLGSLSDNEKIIVSSLNGKRLHIDELQLISKLPSSDIFPILLDMELHGFIRVYPGNYFELLSS